VASLILTPTPVPARLRCWNVVFYSPKFERNRNWMPLKARFPIRAGRGANVQSREIPTIRR
jgi:hypothetical protein